MPIENQRRTLFTSFLHIFEHEFLKEQYSPLLGSVTMTENEKPMQAIVTSGKDVDHHELLNYYRLKKYLYILLYFGRQGFYIFSRLE